MNPILLTMACVYWLADMPTMGCVLFMFAVVFDDD